MKKMNKTRRGQGGISGVMVMVMITVMLVAISLAGCGGKKTGNDIGSVTSAVSETKAEAAPGADASAEITASDKDKESVETSAAAAESSEAAGIEETVKYRLVEFEPDMEVTVDDDYKIAWNLCNILGDIAMSEGAFYYYNEGTENGVPWYEWVTADGKYTSCEVTVSITNLNENMETSFNDRIQGVFVYNVPGNIDELMIDDGFIDKLTDMAKNDPEMEIVELTYLQENPDQVDVEGCQVRSKDAVLLEKNQTVRQTFLGDISRTFFDSWNNCDKDKTIRAYFTYGDGNIYTIDLQKYMADSGMNEPYSEALTARLEKWEKAFGQ